MIDLKANSTMAALIPSDSHGRDSLLVRRVIGGAVVIGLALLGLAFPALI
jgi:hypothetical protein